MIAYIRGVTRSATIFNLTKIKDLFNFEIWHRNLKKKEEKGSLKFDFTQLFLFFILETLLWNYSARPKIVPSCVKYPQNQLSNIYQYTTLFFLWQAKKELKQFKIIDETPNWLSSACSKSGVRLQPFRFTGVCVIVEYCSRTSVRVCVISE